MNMHARVEALLPREKNFGVFSLVWISTLVGPTTAGSTAARLLSFLVCPALGTDILCRSYWDIGLKDNNT